MLQQLKWIAKIVVLILLYQVTKLTEEEVTDVLER